MDEINRSHLGTFRTLDESALLCWFIGVFALFHRDCIAGQGIEKTVRWEGSEPFDIKSLDDNVGAEQNTH